MISNPWAIKMVSMVLLHADIAHLLLERTVENKENNNNIYQKFTIILSIVVSLNTWKTHPLALISLSLFKSIKIWLTID